MAYCTYLELRNVTGQDDTSIKQTFMEAIIEDADREIDAYLAACGISTPVYCDATKTASLKLAKAGLLDFNIQSGRYVASSGEFINGANTSDAYAIQNTIKQLRAAALEILDQYVTSTTSTTRINGVRVSRIRSRCP